MLIAANFALALILVQSALRKGIEPSMATTIVDCNMSRM
jgi:hypothetical protein